MFVASAEETDKFAVFKEFIHICRKLMRIGEILISF